MALLTHYQLNDCVRANEIMEKIVFNQDYIGESLLASILQMTDKHINISKFYPGMGNSTVKMFKEFIKWFLERI